MTEIYYTIDEDGAFKKHRVKEVPSGKYQFIQGKWTRTGDAKAVPDEPWCNKALDWHSGIKNPADGKTYGSKGQYLDAVKRSGSRVVGEEAKTTKKREIAGDYNVRKELTAATRQVLSKHGRSK